MILSILSIIFLCTIGIMSLQFAFNSWDLNVVEFFIVLLIGIAFIIASLFSAYTIGNKQGQIRIMSGQEAEYELVINDDKSQQWRVVSGKK